VVAQAWKVNGIDYQASFLDEGHVTLDRRGKPDSLLSAMMTAVSDNTPYYMAMTADPAKNDISEIRSQLDKLYPDGRYGSEDEWHKRYGINTSASRDALRREVESKFFTQEISPPTKMRPSERTVELHPWQQAEYEKITYNFDKARAAMSRGEVAVDALKALRPERFDGVPAEQHEAIGRQLQRGLATMQENLLNRVVNLAPADRNAGILQSVWVDLGNDRGVDNNDSRQHG